MQRYLVEAAPQAATQSRKKMAGRSRAAKTAAKT
jgi:hypothetical protein